MHQGKKYEVKGLCGLLHCALPQLSSEVREAKKELKKAQTIMQLDELKCRKRVLRRYHVVCHPLPVPDGVTVFP